jgi:pentatricopeptide repeat protein
MQRLQLRNGKKKLALLATVPMLGIKTATAVGFEREEGEGEGNANKSIADDVRVLCNKGRLKQALRILHVMEQPVDCCTYVLLLQLCIKKEAFSEGKSVHTHMNQRGFTGTTLLGNTLLNMYAKCGNLADARRVFHEMSERDVCSWTVMIAAYSRAGLAGDAMDLFHEMQSTVVQPNQFTFASVLQACAKLETLQKGMDIHRHIITGGFQSDVIVESALVDMYAKCGSIEDARQVFDKMHQRDVVSWNTMIAGYAQDGDFDEALNLFHKMPEPDLVSWNTMIAGYAQNRGAKEALKLFKKMQLRDLKSNPKTYASILQACADLASLEQGLQIHGDAIRRGFQSNIFVESALVDMYAKCGSIEKARDLFDRMHQRNAISWTAMIGGYAMHGYAKEALQLFEQMQYSGVNPNHVTILCVLSACCHKGLVKEGRQYFDCMSQCYNITPAIEHYVCMVDLLARSGHLDEAWDFIHQNANKT